MSSLINRAAVKRLALAHVAANRAHPYTRVSKEFLDRIEARLRGIIHTEAVNQPSKGTTLR